MGTGPTESLEETWTSQLSDVMPKSIRISVSTLKRRCRRQRSSIAAGKLFERLRRARDRAKDHRRHYQPHPHEEFDPRTLESELEPEAKPAAAPRAELKSAYDLKPGEAREEQLGDSPVIVRQKVHEAEPMSVDEALDQMELVTHSSSSSTRKRTNRAWCITVTAGRTV